MQSIVQSTVQSIVQSPGFTITHNTLLTHHSSPLTPHTSSQGVLELAHDFPAAGGMEEGDEGEGQLGVETVGALG